ncbi:hypothetical protein HUU53_02750 [Candidatus Micrarchaeota archaeon]|nr:hypothetical protein [Candidatus Micrarchaeota archaeon]
MTQPYLFKFFGREDPNSMEMTTVVNDLEKKLGLSVLRLEVWHNHQNKKLFDKTLKKLQMRELSLPAFFNKKTGQLITGTQDYSTLESWAKGKK